MFILSDGASLTCMMTRGSMGDKPLLKSSITALMEINTALYNLSLPWYLYAPVCYNLCIIPENMGVSGSETEPISVSLGAYPPNGHYFVSTSLLNTCFMESIM